MREMRGNDRDEREVAVGNGGGEKRGTSPFLSY